jgi:hypothetical protein
MTRDDVLDEALRALAANDWSPSQPYRIIRALKSRPPEKSPDVMMLTRDDVIEECAREIEFNDVRCDAKCSTDVRAMKSRPSEKSPEVVLASNSYDTSVMSHAELADAVFDLVHQRDALRAKLDAQEKLAAESVARVEALTAELNHERWVKDGAPMKGETP